MSGLPDSLAARVAALVTDPMRALVAVVGPPGAGKSHLSEALVVALNENGAPAALLAMDGFHLDNRILAARGLLARKGAPETFDAAGLATTLRRLRDEEEVIHPVFDRARDIAIAGAGRIGPEHRIVVVEGNYLLLDRPPWRELAAGWTLSVFLEVGMAELEARLIARWRDHGLDADAARARARGNDLTNAGTVLDHSAGADLRLRWDASGWRDADPRAQR